MDESAVDRNRAQQAAWYGEPVGETVRRLVSALDLTQGQLAQLVGLSAPMLSQLASGQRAKIANPAVLARLQALAAIADDPALPELSRAELARRTQAVRDLEQTGRARHHAAARPEPGPPRCRRCCGRWPPRARCRRRRRCWTARSPALAEVLRVYGLGRTAEARAHWADVVEAAD